MATFGDIKNRVKRMESTMGTDDANVVAAIEDAINEAQETLYQESVWWWAVTTATVTATDSGASLILPEAALYVVGVLNSDNEPVQPRRRQRQIEWQNEITEKGIFTYAMNGYDDTTGYPVLSLHPATAGDYEVRYQPEATALTSDTDTIAGPPSVARYLTWYARWVRLAEDEASESLSRNAQMRFSFHLSQLKHQNSGFVRSIRTPYTVG